MALSKGSVHVVKTLLQHSDKARFSQILASSMIYVPLATEASFVPTLVPAFGNVSCQRVILELVNTDSAP